MKSVRAANRVKHDTLPPDDIPGIVTTLGRLGAGAVITEEGISHLFRRHGDSVKRAVERGELPPPTRLFGQPTWTVGTLLRHLEHRLEEAAKEAETLRNRIKSL